MKVCILAGGLGTRFSEVTVSTPKPMIEIGGMPILWHIMKYYSCFGHNEFVILGGYKIEEIKRFFQNYNVSRASSIRFSTSTGKMNITSDPIEDWEVTVVDTGLETMTASRILRAQHIIGEEPFMLTYGDGVSNIDLNALAADHSKNDSVITLSAVRPEARFGALDITDLGSVRAFVEKPISENGWVNGGYMVCNAQVFNYINDYNNSVLETDVLMQLAKNSKLSARRHDGFWKPMDTARDRNLLQKLYQDESAPWTIWR